MRTAPVSIAEAAGGIVASHTPVLFLDTCALLDIIRLPSRARSARDSETLLAAAISILDRAKGDQLSLVIPPLVTSELEKNLSNVEEEARNAVETLKLRYSVIASIQKTAGDSMAPLAIDANAIVTFLKDLTTELMASGTELGEGDEPAKRAWKRAVENTAPSSKGTVNDCIVYEHTLQLMRVVRDAGHQQALVFLTSNTKDFCDSGAAKEPVQAELADINAYLCTTWNWALNQLTVGEG